MSVLLTAFNVGNIVGPSVGGFTAFPSLVYPGVFSKDGLFAMFPALLPNLIVAVGIAIGIPLTIIYLRKDAVDPGHDPLLDNNMGESRRSLLDMI